MVRRKCAICRDRVFFRARTSHRHVGEARRLGRPLNRDRQIPEEHGRRSDQALPVIEALRIMTIRAAYAMRCEGKTGSLKPGKLADLVVLSGNPLEIDPANMEDIHSFFSELESQYPELKIRVFDIKDMVNSFIHELNRFGKTKLKVPFQASAYG